MLIPYFVVARESGNIIRITRRDGPPTDTDTVVNLRASLQGLERYEKLLDSGQELIGLASLQGTPM